MYQYLPSNMAAMTSHENGLYFTAVQSWKAGRSHSCSRTLAKGEYIKVENALKCV